MRVIISGGWSYGNIGDEAIAKTTQYELNKIWPGAEYYYLSYNPEEFFRHHQIPSLKSIHRLIRDAGGLNLTIHNIENRIDALGSGELKSYSDLFNDKEAVFIMSGGGYFLESWEEQLISRIAEILIAKKHGAKVCIIGQSIGPFYTDEARWLVGKALRLCDYINVRDISSFNVIKSIDKNINVKLSCDIANDIASCYQYQEKDSKNKKIISMMLAVYSHRETADNRKKHNKTLIKIFNRVTLRKYLYEHKIRKIVTNISRMNDCLVQIVMSTDWTWDVAFVKRVTRNIDPDRYVIINGAKVDELCDAISKSDYMISCKMHPLIIANSFGIPTIGISYNFKVDDFMNSIDRAPFCFINKDLSVSQFFSAFNTAPDYEHIATIAEAQKSKVREMFAEIKMVIH